MKLLDRLPDEKARAYAIRVLLYNITALELSPGSAVSENELSAVMNLSTIWNSWKQIWNRNSPMPIRKTFPYS